MTGIYRSPEGERAVRQRYLEVLAACPVPSEHVRVPTREGETFVLSCGPPTAPPLLLFQGSGANAAMWFGDLPLWAEHFRVHAVDVIGEPGLSAASRPPLATDAHALWLDDVLTGLSIERAAMVGVSLGAWLVLDYATRRPDRVRRAVALCPAGVGRQRRSFMLKALPLLLLGRPGRRRILRMLAGATADSRTVVASSPGAGATARLLPLIHRHFRPRRETVPVFGDAALARLTLPLLVIVGGRDPMLDSFDTRRRLERAVPGVTVRFLPEAGHILPAQTEPVLEFLLRH